MDAHEFFAEFIHEVKESTIVSEEMIPDHPEIWGKYSFLNIYRDYEAIYTQLINKYVISKIIKSAGMKSQNEYFRVDTVGWISHYKDMENDAKTKELKLNAHLWDLKIAVEHENSKKDWTDEVIKLIHIKCPLKVVIGYNFCDGREELECMKLDFIARWMQKIKAFNQGSDEEYLLIFGNCYNPKTKADYTEFDYRGYLYNHLTQRFDRI